MQMTMNIFQESIVKGSAYLAKRFIGGGFSQVEFVWEAISPFLKMYGIEPPICPLVVDSYIKRFEKVEEPLPGDLVIFDTNIRDNNQFGLGIVTEDHDYFIFYSSLEERVVNYKLSESFVNPNQSKTYLRMWKQSDIPNFIPDENTTYEGEFSLPKRVFDEAGNIVGMKEVYFKVFAYNDGFSISGLKVEEKG